MTNIKECYGKVLAQPKSIIELMQEGQYTSDKIVVPTCTVNGVLALFREISDALGTAQTLYHSTP